MTSTRILYDGWPLVYEAYGPAAMHLQALLAHLPAQVEPVVALPGPAPDWLLNTRIQVQPTPESDYGRLLWEQRSLPQIARQADAQVLHMTTPNAPLLGGVASVVSPGAFEETGAFSGLQSRAAWKRPQEMRSFAARLRLSLANGGLARARAIFWPEDVPEPELPIPVVRLPPVVHPAFTSSDHGPILPENPVRESNGHSRGERKTGLEFNEQARILAAFDLPETYVLYHGPTSPFWLLRLLESWQWANGPIGAEYPLVILGMPEGRRETLDEIRRQFDPDETVRALPAVPVEVLPAVYRGCSVYFHPAPLSPWGDPVRNALACGKPVVATESRLADAIVGPAAYLVPGEDTRALGAALLTVIVEEEVAGNLAESAWQRSVAWHGPAFGQALFEAYRRILSQGEPVSEI